MKKKKVIVLIFQILKTFTKKKRKNLKKKQKTKNKFKKN